MAFLWHPGIHKLPNKAKPDDSIGVIGDDIDNTKETGPYGEDVRIDQTNVK